MLDKDALRLFAYQLDFAIPIPDISPLPGDIDKTVEKLIEADRRIGEASDGSAEESVHGNLAAEPTAHLYFRSGPP